MSSFRVEIALICVLLSVAKCSLGDKRSLRNVSYSTVKVLAGHTSAVVSLAVLPNASLASGSYDTTVRVWNLTSDQTTQIFNNRIWAVTSVVLLPDGSLAVGYIDYLIRIWDLTNG